MDGRLVLLHPHHSAVGWGQVDESAEGGRGGTHLRVEGRVLNVAVDEDPEVALDHEGLDVGRLELLVQLLAHVPGSTTGGRGWGAGAGGGVSLCAWRGVHMHMLLQEVQDGGTPWHLMHMTGSRNALLQLRLYPHRLRLHPLHPRSCCCWPLATGALPLTW